MKITILPVLGLAACVFSAQAQFFTNGNLAVVSVGGPGQFASTTNGLSVSILQFTTNGSQVGTLALPTNGASAFTLTGGFTEGFASISPDGLHLVLGGYNSAIPLSGGPAAATSTNAPRAIATIDGYGNYLLPIANTNILSTFNIRGAAYDGT